MAQFMALVLGEPRQGIYANAAIGKAGHFTTAPEISQIFGELVGLCLVQAWLDQGQPAPFVLAEAGPGRGTLMADLLRAARTVPDFLAAAELHLIETSAPLRTLQAECLARVSPGLQPHFHAGLDTLPVDRPLFLVANEFLDALPIHQFVRTESGWRERVVALDETGSFVFATGQVVPAPSDDPELDFLEASPAREAWMQALAARLANRPGLGLLIDYGDLALKGETLQALRHHQRAHPLDDPGSADLSSHVAFAPLAIAARRAGCTVHGPVTQAAFLAALGGAARLARLQRALPSAAASLAAGYERLTHAAEMGVLFKAMAVTGRQALPPPGFASSEPPVEKEG
ncbi:SAM-dependent methyltransferase, MidA family [Arboricoccus pini]|uniref:SAM-dependent methyltransferase, MidA family n=2 Tax=Arboricoccus pini TaxID=1963835 RepID=A0A212S1S7_9PROT|nr:SAM-dependent methyltransferase, MidA family [Arboricoccus pini]